MQALHVRITKELLALGVTAVYELPDHTDPRIDQSAARRRRK